MEELLYVWVFSGAGSRFASGIFSSRKIATKWISKYKLTGVLTKYPLDHGAYDWAIANQFFEIRKGHEKSSEFIQNFTSASQEHYHFKDGH